MYPENPEGTQVIVGSMNMGYISDTARNRTHNLFRPKREPIPLGHSDGLLNHWPLNPEGTRVINRRLYEHGIWYLFQFAIHPGRSTITYTPLVLTPSVWSPWSNARIDAWRIPTVLPSTTITTTAIAGFTRRPQISAHRSNGMMAISTCSRTDVVGPHRNVSSHDSLFLTFSVQGNVSTTLIL